MFVNHNPPLHIASENGYDDVVSRLLEAGCNVNRIGGVLGTALSAAATFGHTITVRRLLREGAKVDLIAGLYGTALRAAASGGF